MEKKRIQQELEMISRGDHKEIMDYITEHSLCDKVELALIERGNHDEIMRYVSNNIVYPENMAAIMKRGNKEEIDEAWNFNPYNLDD